MEERCSRRKFICKSFFTGIASIGAGVLVIACNSNSSSTGHNDSSGVKKDNQPGMDSHHKDSAGIPQSDLQKRKQLGYVTVSPMPDRSCSNCALYLPPKPGEPLGNCQLFKGNVLPGAYCTYWAAPQQ